MDTGPPQRVKYQRIIEWVAVASLTTVMMVYVCVNKSFRPRFSYAIIEKELQENLGLERLSWEGLWADLLLNFSVSHIEWTYPLAYQGVMIDERFSYWQRLTWNTSKFPVIKDEISLL